MDYFSILYRTLASKIQREQEEAASQGGGTEEPSTPGGGTEEPSTPGSLTDEQIEQIITEEVDSNEMTQDLAQENKEALVTELYRALTQGGDILTATDTKITNLIINKMTKAQYESITPSITEMYYLTDDDIYQEKLTAGSNVQITGNVISATDTTYTAGTNVSIENNVISATGANYTAGNNVQINNNVISATDTTYTAGNNITITGNVISANVPITVEIELTGESGTLTEAQIATVLDDTKNAFLACDGQIFRLINKVSTLTYRTYMNIDVSDDGNLTAKAIYIQLDSEAANYGHWTKEDVTVSGGGVTYTAGDNVQISDQNVISATDTVYTAGSNIQINGTTISAIVSDMTGATSSTDGAHGLAPKPLAGEQNKSLRADGTWETDTVSRYWDRPQTYTDINGNTYVGGLYLEPYNNNNAVDVYYSSVPKNTIEGSGGTSTSSTLYTGIGYMQPANDSYEFSFIFPTLPTTFGTSINYVAYHDWRSYHTFNVYIDPSDTTKLVIGYNNSGWSYYRVDLVANHLYTVTFAGGRIYVDGTQIAAPGNYSNTWKVQTYGGATVNYITYAKPVSIKYKRSGVALLDCVPVVPTSGQDAGWFDKVSRRFIGSSYAGYPWRLAQSSSPYSDLLPRKLTINNCNEAVYDTMTKSPNELYFVSREGEQDNIVAVPSAPYVYSQLDTLSNKTALATTSSAGIVQLDGSTIKVNDGVISVDISQVQVISGGEIAPEEE